MGRGCIAGSRVVGKARGLAPSELLFVLGLLAPILLVSPAGCGNGTTASEPTDVAEKAKQREPFRVLHVMSFHSPWVWTDDQLRGFQASLAEVAVEYEILQLDAKRKSTKEWLEEVSEKTRARIESAKPDLIYLTDDPAMELVGRHFVGSEIPIVFSGVNQDPSQYGLGDASNVTGVLEQEHFIESVRLLVEIVPDVKRIAVIVDDEVTWDGVVKRMRGLLTELPAEVSVVRWDEFETFDAYKKAIARYPAEVEALALLGIFTFKDENGDNVPFETVLKWTAEHSTLPDFSFWGSRAPLGTLASVSVSGYEQGLAAGEMARRILVDGDSPDHIQMRPTVRGEPVISLARARKLGISVRSGLLLSADVETTFAWDDESKR